MTRWSELPLWAWAQGLRNGVNFRASPSSSAPGNTGGRSPLPTVCTNIDEAQVITSAIEYPQATGWHKPVLDIDFPAQLIPSSTEGHFHLYLDKELPWDKYQRLLTALAEAGIIEVGYANASIARGYTAVRVPWVSRADDPAPEPEAAEEAPVAPEAAEPLVRYNASMQVYEIGPRGEDGRLAEGGLALTNEYLRRGMTDQVRERLRGLGVDDWATARDEAARVAGASWMTSPLAAPLQQAFGANPTTGISPSPWPGHHEGANLTVSWEADSPSGAVIAATVGPAVITYDGTRYRVSNPRSTESPLTLIGQTESMMDPSTRSWLARLGVRDWAAESHAAHVRWRNAERAARTNLTTNPTFFSAPPVAPQTANYRISARPGAQPNLTIVDEVLADGAVQSAAESMLDVGDAMAEAAGRGIALGDALVANAVETQARSIHQQAFEEAVRERLGRQAQDAVRGLSL